jgi:hypothetical protein
MSRSNVIGLICRRDGCSAKEAEKLIGQAVSEMEDCGYDPCECEDIMMNILGLEMDYIFDILY